MNPPPARIETQIDDPFVGRVEAVWLTQSAEATLRHQGVTEPAELTVVVTGDETVHRLNRVYRGVDAPTDVLAFWNEDESGLTPDPQAPRYLGDVILSFPRAEAQARQAEHSVRAELQLLTVHGVLHLLGHDHAEMEEKAAMWSAQAEILHRLGLSVDVG